MKDCKTDIFKNALDMWLNTIPDEPQIPGYKAQSNSIRHKTSALGESRAVSINFFFFK